MSVLKSLKGTFQNVQQDIKDGFRALTSLDSTPRHDKIKQLRADGVSFDGGADLLYRYQKEWSEMHSHTAETAKKAEEIDSMVGQMFTKYDRQWQSCCRLEEERATLPAMTATIDGMLQLIGNLKKDFQTVEDELEKLQNLCEEGILLQEKESHRGQLAAYKKKKEAEALSVKGKLWNLLKERAKEVETRKSHAMKERQEAFMDAFASDMDYYRKHGHPDTLQNAPEFPKVSSLSEITIEEDKKALDEFLSSGDGSHHEEGAFIEDDYTADYSTTDKDLSDGEEDDFLELNDNQPIDFDNPGSEADGVISPMEKPDSSCDNPGNSEIDRTQASPGNEDTTPESTEKNALASSEGEICGSKEKSEETDKPDAVPSSDSG